MEDKKKEGRYRRIHLQLEELLKKTEDPISRMASVCAVLHHKMDHFFWTGFYLHHGGRLTVGPYQGPVACQELERDRGVCWASVNTGKPQLVADVHAFPGHIACDSRSKSEITLPVFDRELNIRAVLDVDSASAGAFSEVDRVALEKITALIYR